MDQSERLRKFFHSEAETGMYDDSIELTVPMYQMVHHTIFKLLSYHFGIAYGKDHTEVKGCLLDVGAGTGTESIPILKHFPNIQVTAVDICEPMKKSFDRKYAAEIKDKGPLRYSYIIGDILSLETAAVEWNDRCKIQSEGFIAAISAYCIHHFDAAQKKAVYQKMFDALQPGGIFINADLFNYEDTRTTKFAHDFDISYINNEFKNPDKEFVKSQRIPFKKREVLRKRWIAHYENDNILAPVEIQCQMLKDIGFRSAECVLKYWQQGVICAVK